MDSERLAARLGPWQERLVADQRLPCAQVAVVRHGKVCYQAQAGEQAPGTPLRADTIFRIYSMTKPIVSMALMMLYEEGRFQLNDPVKLWLGKQWSRESMRVFVRGNADLYETVPCKTSIRVWHLLTHTSGLTYGFDAHGVVNPVDALYHHAGVGRTKPGLDLAEFVDKLATMPLMFQPGEHWHYGYNTDVVGRLVECISGLPLDEFLRTRVFEPLAMHDTGFHVPPAKRDRFAALFMPADLDPTLGPRKPASLTRASGLVDISAPSDFNYRSVEELGDKKMLSGGGGLVSTLADYTCFCQMLLRCGRGEPALISRKTLEFMTRNFLPDGQDMEQLAPPGGYSELPEEGIGFGLGFSVVPLSPLGITFYSCLYQKPKRILFFFVFRS